jgi:hypothetical protein
MAKELFGDGIFSSDGVDLLWLSRLCRLNMIVASL